MEDKVFDIPVLTLHVGSTETSLQLSGDLTLFAVSQIHVGAIKKET
jgi:hypothetical protein